MSRSRPQATIAAVCWAAACSPTEVFEDVPESVRYVVVIQGGLATPVISFASGSLSIAVDQETRSSIHGYGAEMEALLGGVDESTWSLERVRPSQECEPTLPRPLWSVEMDSEGSFGELTTEPPSLTASWLLDRCPETAPDNLSLSLDCFPFPCRAEINRRSACRFELTTPACASSPIQVTLDAADRACVGRPDNWICDEAASTIPESLASLSCTIRFLDAEPELCTVDLLRKPERPPFEERDQLRLTLVPGAMGIGSTEVGPVPLERGYLFDFIERPSNTVVITALASAASGPFRCASGMDRPATQFYTLDLDTGAVVSTSSAPPCLFALTPGPVADEYFGVHPDAAGDIWRIVRIGAQNRVLSTRSVPNLMAAGADVISQLEYVRSRNQLLILSRADLRSRLLVLDATTLEVRSEHMLLGEARALALETEHTVLIVSDSSSPSQLIRVDLDASTVRSVPFVSGNLVVSTFRFNGLWYHPFTERSVISASPDLSANYVWDGNSEYVRVSYFEKISQPGRIHPWPLDQDVVLVNALSTKTSGFESNINFIDVRERRMIAGTWLLTEGASPARKILTDVRGRIWFLLSWTGEVIRLTPRQSQP